MQDHANFGEFARVFWLTSCSFPKIAKKSYSFYFYLVLYEDDAQLDPCCCFYTTSIHNLSILVRVSCVLLTLGKLDHGVLFIPFIERRPAYFSSHLRCCQKATHIKWRSCSNFFDGLHLDACNCLWQLTGDLFFCLWCLVCKLHV